METDWRYKLKKKLMDEFYDDGEYFIVEKIK